MLSVAVYLGLRGGHGPDHAPAPLPHATTSEGDAAKGTDGTSSAREELRLQLQRLLEEEWLPVCWHTALAAAPEPAESHYVVQIGFDDAGSEVGRAFSQVREFPSRDDVVFCLREHPPGLRIRSTGAPVVLEFQIYFGDEPAVR